ncbi:MAG: DUF934 domain-containing protein [Gammaproteobacteria bacterium]|nr:DUF934 domain-containing protein [Gammaproteobacteria bacterium]MYF27349.1 DUF934 domain-containing protein [Gammaproteobacteria bacterium]
MLVKAPPKRPERAGAAAATPTMVADRWALVEQGPARPGQIAPLEAWLESPAGAGVWVEGDAPVEDVAPRLIEAPVVAVRFAAFADGRGLTFGKLLRTRYDFGGELRAFGEIVPDLTEYMYRCGFDAFVLANRRQAQAAIACIQRMSDHYQGSFRQPLPAYRRFAEQPQGAVARHS